MRISRSKAQVSEIELPPGAVESPLVPRKRELAALIQAALKVGADYPAREAGRKAWAELTKLIDGLQSNPAGVAMTPSGAVLLAAPKRRRERRGAF